LFLFLTGHQRREGGAAALQYARESTDVVDSLAYCKAAVLLLVSGDLLGIETIDIVSAITAELEIGDIGEIRDLTLPRWETPHSRYGNQ